MKAAHFSVLFATINDKAKKCSKPDKPSGKARSPG